MTHFEDLEKQEPTRPKITLARALEIAAERFDVKPEEALNANFCSQVQMDGARRERELKPPTGPMYRWSKDGPHWTIRFSVRELAGDDGALWSDGETIVVFEDGNAGRSRDLYEEVDP